MVKWYLLWVLMVLQLFQWKLLRTKKIDRIPYRIHHLTPEERFILTTLEGGGPWLSGWNYRRLHAFTSASGAGEYYQKRVRVHHSPKYFEHSGSNVPMGGSMMYPSAYYFSGTYNRTYAVWQGGFSLANYYINYYDHDTERWGTKNNFADQVTADNNHGCPAICISDSGKIVVVYEYHGRIRTKQSTNAEDITVWEAAVNPFGASGYGTYPHFVKISNGDIYLISMHGGTGPEGYRISYVKSTDDGASWGSRNIIVDFASDFTYPGFMVYDSTNDRIHIMWIYYTGGVRQNIYHAYLNISDGKMYSVDGTDLGTTIDATEGDTNCKAVDTGGSETFATCMHLDSNNYPHIIYPLDNGSDYDWYYVKWNGSAWITPVDTGANTDNHFNYSDFIINATDDIEGYLLTSGSAGRGGDVEKWTYDGSVWAQDSVILTEAASGRALNTILVPIDYSSDIKIMFGQMQYDVDDEYPIRNLNLYAWGDDGFIERHTDNDEDVFLQGKCNSDFSDIRFTDDDGTTVLSCWMDDTEGADDDFRYFWIKVDDDLGSNQTIYIYYGNSGASSVSNGKHTFIEFDHFTGDAIDTDMWNVTGTISVAGSIATIETDEDIETKNTYGAGYAVESRNKENEVSGIRHIGFLDTDDTDNYIFLNATGTRKQALCKDDGVLTASEYGYLDAYYHRWTIKRKSGEAKFYEDDFLKATVITNIMADVKPIHFGAYGTGQLDVDWMFIRKYVDPEPAHGAWGSEEVLGAHRGRSTLLIPLMSIICRVKSLFRQGK